MVLLDERDLPRAETYRKQVAVVAPIKEFVAWRFFHLALEERHQVISVEVDLVGLAAYRITLGALCHDIRVTGRRAESWQEVLMSKEIAVNSARFDHARPANQARGSIATLPIGRLLAAVWGRATVRPRHHLSAVVRAVDNDRIVGDPKVIEFLQ